jgi:predicted nucleic acid-binding protein
LRANAAVIIVSDFAAAKFASVIARHVRTRDVTPDNTRIAFSTFDAWTSQGAERAEIRRADVTAAEAFLRRLDPNLRTPDTVNIAIAQRIAATLVSFDDKMIASARALGPSVAVTQAIG